MKRLLNIILSPINFTVKTMLTEDHGQLGNGYTVFRYLFITPLALLCLGLGFYYFINPCHWNVSPYVKYLGFEKTAVFSAKNIKCDFLWPMIYSFITYLIGMILITRRFTHVNASCGGVSLLIYRLLFTIPWSMMTLSFRSTTKDLVVTKSKLPVRSV